MGWAKLVSFLKVLNILIKITATRLSWTILLEVPQLPMPSQIWCESWKPVNGGIQCASDWKGNKIAKCLVFHREKSPFPSIVPIALMVAFHSSLRRHCMSRLLFLRCTSVRTAVGQLCLGVHQSSCHFCSCFFLCTVAFKHCFNCCNRAQPKGA